MLHPPNHSAWEVVQAESQHCIIGQDWKAWNGSPRITRSSGKVITGSQTWPPRHYENYLMTTHREGDRIGCSAPFPAIIPCRPKQKRADLSGVCALRYVIQRTSTTWILQRWRASAGYLWLACRNGAASAGVIVKACRARSHREVDMPRGGPRPRLGTTRTRPPPVSGAVCRRTPDPTGAACCLSEARLSSGLGPPSGTKRR